MTQISKKAGEKVHDKKDTGTSEGRSWLSGSIKGLGQVSGASILLKDAKRMRPRYPKLWKDIASPAKWKEAASVSKITKQPLWKSLLTTILTWAVGFGILRYAILFINNETWISNASTSSKLSMLLLVVVGMIQVVAYTAITAIKIYQITEKHKSRSEA